VCYVVLLFCVVITGCRLCILCVFVVVVESVWSVHAVRILCVVL